MGNFICIHQIKIFMTSWNSYAKFWLSAPRIWILILVFFNKSKNEKNEYQSLVKSAVSATESQTFGKLVRLPKLFSFPSDTCIRKIRSKKFWFLGYFYRVFNLVFMVLRRLNSKFLSKSFSKKKGLAVIGKKNYQTVYIYIYIYIIGPAVRVFANGPGDLGSIPGRVIPKTLKMVLDTTLLNTQHYKVRFKGKVEQSWEWSSALPYTLV